MAFIELRVISLDTDREVVIDIHSGSFVGELKAAIAATEGIAVDRQQLLLPGGRVADADDPSEAGSTGAARPTGYHLVPATATLADVGLQAKPRVFLRVDGGLPPMSVGACIMSVEPRRGAFVDPKYVVVQATFTDAIQDVVKPKHCIELYPHGKPTETVPGSVTYTGSSGCVVFRPHGPLRAGLKYTARIRADCVKYQYCLTALQDATWTFITRDRRLRLALKSPLGIQNVSLQAPGSLAEFHSAVVERLGLAAVLSEEHPRKRRLHFVVRTHRGTDLHLKRSADVKLLNSGDELRVIVTEGRRQLTEEELRREVEPTAIGALKPPVPKAVLKRAKTAPVPRASPALSKLRSHVVEDVLAPIHVLSDIREAKETRSSKFARPSLYDMLGGDIRTTEKSFCADRDLSYMDPLHSESFMLSDAERKKKRKTKHSSVMDELIDMGIVDVDEEGDTDDETDLITEMQRRQEQEHPQSSAVAAVQLSPGAVSARNRMLPSHSRRRIVDEADVVDVSASAAAKRAVLLPAHSRRRLGETVHSAFAETVPITEIVRPIEQRVVHDHDTDRGDDQGSERARAGSATGDEVAVFWGELRTRTRPLSAEQLRKGQQNLWRQHEKRRAETAGRRRRDTADTAGHGAPHGGQGASEVPVTPWEENDPSPAYNQSVPTPRFRDSQPPPAEADHNAARLQGERAPSAERPKTSDGTRRRRKRSKVPRGGTAPPGGRRSHSRESTGSLTNSMSRAFSAQRNRRLGAVRTARTSGYHAEPWFVKTDRARAVPPKSATRLRREDAEAQRRARAKAERRKRSAAERAAVKEQHRRVQQRLDETPGYRWVSGRLVHASEEVDPTAQPHPALSPFDPQSPFLKEVRTPGLRHLHAERGAEVRRQMKSRLKKEQAERKKADEEMRNTMMRAMSFGMHTEAGQHAAQSMADGQHQLQAWSDFADSLDVPQVDEGDDGTTAPEGDNKGRGLDSANANDGEAPAAVPQLRVSKLSRSKSARKLREEMKEEKTAPLPVAEKRFSILDDYPGHEAEAGNAIATTVAQLVLEVTERAAKQSSAMLADRLAAVGDTELIDYVLKETMASLSAGATAATTSAKRAPAKAKAKAKAEEATRQGPRRKYDELIDGLKSVPPPGPSTRRGRARGEQRAKPGPKRGKGASRKQVEPGSSESRTRGTKRSASKKASKQRRPNNKGRKAPKAHRSPTSEGRTASRKRSKQRRSTQRTRTSLGHRPGVDGGASASRKPTRRTRTDSAASAMSRPRSSSRRSPPEKRLAYPREHRPVRESKPRAAYAPSAETTQAQQSGSLPAGRGDPARATRDTTASADVTSGLEYGDSTKDIEWTPAGDFIPPTPAAQSVSSPTKGGAGGSPSRGSRTVATSPPPPRSRRQKQVSSHESVEPSSSGPTGPVQPSGAGDSVPAAEAVAVSAPDKSTDKHKTDGIPAEATPVPTERGDPRGWPRLCTGWTIDGIKVLVDAVLEPETAEEPTVDDIERSDGFWPTVDLGRSVAVDVSAFANGRSEGAPIQAGDPRTLLWRKENFSRGAVRVLVHDPWTGVQDHLRLVCVMFGRRREVDADGVTEARRALPLTSVPRVVAPADVFLDALHFIEQSPQTPGEAAAAEGFADHAGATDHEPTYYIDMDKVDLRHAAKAQRHRKFAASLAGRTRSGDLVVVSVTEQVPRLGTGALPVRNAVHDFVLQGHNYTKHALSAKRLTLAELRASSTPLLRDIWEAYAAAREEWS